MPGWLIPLLISTAMQVVAYLITPKPKGPKPPSLDDFKSPTASADREIPWLWGEMTLSGPNAVFSGEKSIRTYEA